MTIVLDPVLERSMDMPEREATYDKVARIDLTEFAEALSTGILRALDARNAGLREDLKSPIELKPWIWCGWIMGDDKFPGPFGGGGIPGGPGGPGGPIG